MHFSIARRLEQAAIGAQVQLSSELDANASQQRGKASDRPVVTTVQVRRDDDHPSILADTPELHKRSPGLIEQMKHVAGDDLVEAPVGKDVVDACNAIPKHMGAPFFPRDRLSIEFTTVNNLTSRT